MYSASKSVLLFMLLYRLGYSRNIGKFWHVTDLHVDNRYSVNGNPDFMCWEIDGMNIVDTINRPGKFGNYKCDSPQSLVDSAIDAMKDILPHPDFIIWTGDDATHVNESFFSTQIIVGIVANLTNDIKRRFPHTPVLPSLGNHDVHPKYQMRPGRSELLTKVANLWKGWLDLYDAYPEFLENGRYVASINDSNLSVMNLNTLLWPEKNKITRNDLTAKDPGNQFNWADSQLQRLKSQGKKVYVIGHIPPGYSIYKGREEIIYQQRYNKQYIKMVNKYGSTIAGQFFGHLHRDSFRIFLLKNGDSITPVSFALLAPSVTPWSQSNPGLRLITYDQDTADILESTTYYLDLSRANEINKAIWVHEYNLTKLLGLNIINAHTLYEATKRMKESSKLFDLYYQVYNVQLESTPHCSQECREVQLCSITNLDYSDFNNCSSSSETIYSSSTLVLGIILLLFALSNNLTHLFKNERIQIAFKRHKILL